MRLHSVLTLTWASLAYLLLLSGCGLLPTQVAGTPTPDAQLIPTAVVDVTESSTPSAQPGDPTPAESTVIPTATASPSPTSTLQPPAPTCTLTPAPPSATVVPPTETASSTATPSGAAIRSFQALPQEVDPGDTVTLTWEATGNSATICPVARLELFTSDDCREVELTGSETFVLPQEVSQVPYVHFTLTVGTPSEPASATTQTSVALKCNMTWFFSDEPQAGICPTEATQSQAAAQHFERGTMIWIEQFGRYYVLLQTFLFEGDVRKAVDLISDPLQITDDTAAEVELPEGLHAPQSGFGLVWRGDVVQSTGYRERLGWALEPEFAYQTIYQCDDALPSGGQSWRTCYLRGPDGQVIVFHPLGGWHFLGER